MNIATEINHDLLKENGFFYFEICKSGDIEKLKNLYADTQNNNKRSGMFVTHNSGDSDAAIRTSENIKQILDFSIKKLFPEYDYFLGHFAVKSSQTLHNFDLHRDWNLVDESVHNSIQIWFPLSMCYPENGGMCFIPHSYSFRNAPRSGSLGIPLIKIEPDVYPYLSYSRLRPGQAVCFYSNTFHGSFSNSTDDDRVAVLINLIPKNTETEYFHWNKSAQKIQTYSMTAKELLTSLPDLEKGKTPVTTLRREVDISFPLQKQSYIPKEYLLDWLSSIDIERKNSSKINKIRFLEQYPIPISYRIKQWFKNNFFSSNNG